MAENYLPQVTVGTLQRQLALYEKDDMAPSRVPREVLTDYAYYRKNGGIARNEFAELACSFWDIAGNPIPMYHDVATQTVSTTQSGFLTIIPVTSQTVMSDVAVSVAPTVSTPVGLTVVAPVIDKETGLTVTQTPVAETSSNMTGTPIVPAVTPSTLTSVPAETVVVTQSDENKGLVDMIDDWAAGKIKNLFSKHKAVYTGVFYRYPDSSWYFETGSGRFIITAAEAKSLYMASGGKNEAYWNEGAIQLETPATFNGIVKVGGVYYDSNLFGLNTKGYTSWDASFNKYWSNAYDLNKVTKGMVNASVFIDPQSKISLIDPWKKDATVIGDPSDPAPVDPNISLGDVTSSVNSKNLMVPLAILAAVVLFNTKK